MHRRSPSRLQRADSKPSYSLFVISKLHEQPSKELSLDDIPTTVCELRDTCAYTPTHRGRNKPLQSPRPRPRTRAVELSRTCDLHALVRARRKAKTQE
eukprot:6182864-Pleurochrysis_carterae.AAC.1